MRLLVLENEAGQVALDDRLLRELPLEVRLLPGGCACCDLQGVLVDLLKQVQGEGRWDLVLLEPSGVASLASLHQLLERFVPELGQSLTLTVVDASRYATMTRALPKLLADHLAASRQVVLSKADLASAGQVSRISGELRLAAPRAQVWPADLRGEGAYVLARELAPRLTAGELQYEMAKVTAGDGPHQARSFVLDLPPAGLAARAARGLVAEIVAALNGPQANWLGHVKLWGQDQGGAQLLVSGTTARDVGIRGESPGPVQDRAWLVVISHADLPDDLYDLVRIRLVSAVPGAELRAISSAPTLLSL